MYFIYPAALFFVFLTKVQSNRILNFAFKIIYKKNLMNNFYIHTLFNFNIFLFIIYDQIYKEMKKHKKKNEKQKRKLSIKKKITYL